MHLLIRWLVRIFDVNLKSLFDVFLTFVWFSSPAILSLCGFVSGLLFGRGYFKFSISSLSLFYFFDSGSIRNGNVNLNVLLNAFLSFVCFPDLGVRVLSTNHYD